MCHLQTKELEHFLWGKGFAPSPAPPLLILDILALGVHCTPPPSVATSMCSCKCLCCVILYCTLTRHSVIPTNIQYFKSSKLIDPRCAPTDSAHEPPGHSLRIVYNPGGAISRVNWLQGNWVMMDQYPPAHYLPCMYAIHNRNCSVRRWRHTR